MRSTTGRAALGFVLAAIVAASMLPAGATSAYHMNGQGTITMGGDGIPGCVHVVEVPDCGSPAQTFDWGNLTVQGAGLLQDVTVAGSYQCRSTGNVAGTPFVSKIRGNTTNFVLTFNFACTRSSGDGPASINGWFSNVTGSSSDPALQSTDGHEHPSPVMSGFFSFKGYFAASNIHPYNIDSGNGDPMSCGGGFAPVAMNGTKIKQASFVGECNALAA